MQFMIMAKATKESQVDVMLSEQIIGRITKGHGETRKAHTQLDASGLQPSSEGSRMKYSGGRRTVIDGPFAETKEVMGGHMLIQAKEEKGTTESKFYSVEEGGVVCPHIYRGRL